MMQNDHLEVQEVEGRGMLQEELCACIGGENGKWMESTQDHPGYVSVTLKALQVSTFNQSWLFIDDFLRQRYANVVVSYNVALLPYINV